MLLAGLLFLAGTVSADNSKGVFSVSATQTVQFKMENETAATNNLVQWSELSSYESGEWRVLTHSEWKYLLVTRDGEGMSKNALGKVNGVNGLIILPDGWVQTAALPTFKDVTQGIDYDNNVYDASEWALMAESGAVFLPSDGYGYSSPVEYEDQGSRGNYWAKGEYSTANAYCVRFEFDDIHDNNNAAKTNYYSVRLVRDVPVLDEADEQTAFDTKMGVARSQDVAFMRRTLYKDGYFNTLCLPFDVPSIAASPLAGAEVYTFESGEVAGDVLQLNVEPVTGYALAKGVPYLIRWSSGDDVSFLCFDGISSWDGDDAAGDDPGSSDVKYHGFYYKTHINDVNDGADTHYNFFLGANDVLYWPSDGGDAGAKMSGFRAHFYIEPNGNPSAAPRRGMPAVLRIKDATTDLDDAALLYKAQKMLREGRVVIVINGESYTIGGQKL